MAEVREREPREVRGSRRVLLPVLATLGVMVVLTSASWFRTMEVSAPHYRIMQRIADAPGAAPRARAGGRVGGGGVGGGDSGGSRGGSGEAGGGSGAGIMAELHGDGAHAGGAPAPTPEPARGVPARGAADATAAQSARTVGQARGVAPARACVSSPTVPALTDCLLRPLARSNVVINSVADKKYSLYAINYVLALRAANVSNFVMGALDAELLATFRGMGAPSFSLANITARSAWHATNRHKIRVVLAFLELRVGVLFTDIDVMFMQNPMPFLNKWPQADQFVSSDMQYVPKRSGSGELEDVTQFKVQHASPLNVGIMLVRPSAANVAFVSDWLVRSEREMGVSMQAIYDILLRTNHTCSVDHETELATCYRPALKVGLLPIDRFLNGYTYFITHLPEKRHVEPIAIHATFQVHQATVAKIHRFREARLFFDNAAYYAPERKYISFTPRLPDWLAGAADNPALKGPRRQLPYHFALVHHQLGQLRWAIALALALNRTLVLPRFTCLLDNSWYPMMGAWPGFRIAGPFHCPADHVLNLERMHEELGQERFREHSFFDNVRTPAVSKAPPRVVLLEGDGAPVIGHPSLPLPTQPPVRIPRNATSAQARGVLGGIPDAVLHFETLIDAFSKFSAQAEQIAFERKVKRITTLWCCVDGGTARELGQKFPPGHIYYDPFWDRPHVDRFGRTQGVPFKMLVGERDMSL